VQLPTIWLERFILGGVCLIVVSLVILNPLKFDWTVRILLGVLILGVSYFVGHTIEKRRTEKPPSTVPMVEPSLLAPVPMIEPSLPAPVISGRTFVTATPDYLVGLYYSEDMTAAQADALLKPYVGQWMRISGNVQDVLGNGPKLLVFKQYSLVNRNHVFMQFDNVEDFDLLATLRKGEPITVQGKILKASAIGLFLWECEIEGR
jgi:hypothetical protein